METTIKEIPHLCIGIEAGGTTFVVGCALPLKNSTYPFSSLLKRKEFDTDHSNPITTMESIKNIISSWIQQYSPKLVSIGIASFGPIDLEKGILLKTPKKAWNNFSIVQYFRNSFPQATVQIETDVNAAALSESHALNVQNCCYITIGTGVGVGVIVQGSPLHGSLHPEAGHIFVPLHASDIGLLNDESAKLSSPFKGTCPFHGNCIEGMISSGACSARRKVPAKSLKDLDDSDPLWPIVAHYLSHLCVNITLFTAPDAIIIGGGIGQRKSLFKSVRANVLDLLGGYFQSKPFVDQNLDNYIIQPQKSADAGVFGALVVGLVHITTN